MIVLPARRRPPCLAPCTPGPRAPSEPETSRDHYRCMGSDWCKRRGGADADRWLTAPAPGSRPTPQDGRLPAPAHSFVLPSQEMEVKPVLHAAPQCRMEHTDGGLVLLVSYAQQPVHGFAIWQSHIFHGWRLVQEVLLRGSRHAHCYESCWDLRQSTYRLTAASSRSPRYYTWDPAFILTAYALLYQSATSPRSSQRALPP